MDRFAEKLDDLMRLENVTNAKLARALLVDASLISRWRRGERVPGDNTEHIAALAAFFAAGAKEEYQRREILKLTGLSALPGSETAELASAIAGWFRQSVEDEKHQDLSALIRNICRTGPDYPENAFNMMSFSDCAVQNGQYFTGTDGRQQAALLLLKRAARRDKPCHLMLFSDGPLDWITEGNCFYQQMLALFQAVVAKGGRVQFIHPSTRSHGQVASRIDVWLPFYLTGAVEVFSCGKYRDSLFQRLLVIVPGVGALDSGGLVASDDIATFFLTDPTAVEGLRQQLEEVLKICQSSMSVCRTADALITAEVMADYWLKDGEILFKGNVLQLNTLPDDMLDELMERTALPEVQRRDVRRAIRLRVDNFFRSIERNVCIAMVPLHTPEEVAAGTVCFSNAELLFGVNLPYTVDQYARHLANIIRIMRENRNYLVQVIEEEVWNHVLIMSKLGAGTVLSKLQEPVFTFFSDYEDYPQLTETVYEGLEAEYEKLPPLWRTHSYNLRRLTEQYKRFERWLEVH